MLLTSNPQENKGNERDIISNIPDCLLHHILSFLNTKQVVQTSVLSHRWNHVWVDVPTLRFSFIPFPYKNNPYCHIDDTDPKPYIESYSPGQSPYEPRYSPSSPAVYSPLGDFDPYSPVSPIYEPSSYSPTGPKCVPSSYTYSPTCPTYEGSEGSIHKPSTPPYKLSSPIYSPTNPAYYLETSSPMYSPTSPTYEGFESSICKSPSPSYSPTLPDYNAPSPGYSPCYYYTPVPSRSPPLIEKKISSFIDCVLSFLTKRSESSKIDKFVLWCHCELKQEFVDSIIPKLALDHNVREIEICSKRGNYLGHGIHLPQCLYTKDSLEKLELGIPRLILTDGFATVRELKLYGMDGTKNKSNDCVICPEFFSRCPVLETLSLTSCTLDFMVLTISAPRLKNLEISYCYFDGVVISSPLLSYFIFEGKEPMYNLSMEGDCSSLEVIDIDIRANPHCCFDVKGEAMAKSVVEMLSQFRTAETVVMSLNTMEILNAITGSSEGTQKLFPCLKKFMLKTKWSIPEKAWNLVVKSNSTSEVETSVLLLSMPRLRPKCFKQS